MKKLLLGSVVLTVFSSSVALFQMSCNKTSNAQTGPSGNLPPATTSTLGGIIVGNGLNVTSNGTLSVVSSGGTSQLSRIVYVKTKNDVSTIWTANYDGTNQVQINVTFPAGTYINDQVRLSPDGQRVFFQVEDNQAKDHIYTCKIDGSGLTKIIDGNNEDPKGIVFGGAY